MKQISSLLWKEWRETRAFLWIAIGVFIGLPVIRGLEAIWQYSRRFEVSTSPWVLAFGGVLAIFVAIGATCRDFNGHLDDFWRSRPISTTRWMLTKYLVGLVVVLAGCVLPLIVELAIGPGKESPPLVIPLIVFFPFVWTALYSLGFLSGCLVRRTAHAAMLALSAMLLVNFLPMVLPPLHWLDVSAVMSSDLRLPRWQYISPFANHWRRLEWLALYYSPILEFAAGMLGIAMAAHSLALLAVKRDWRIESGRKMMYGSISAAVLILVSSAGYQLGNSLPILQEIAMPDHEQATRLVFDGGRYFVMSSVMDEATANLGHGFKYRAIELTPTGIKLGDPVAAFFGWGPWGATEAPMHSEIAYYLTADIDSDRTLIYVLNTTGLAPQHWLWRQRRYDERPSLYAWKDRLYVMGTHLATLDISQPDDPRVISNVPLNKYSQNNSRGISKNELESNSHRADTLLIALPQVPGLPPAQRLDAELKTSPFWGINCYEGDIVCMLSRYESTLLAYRVVKLTDSEALLEKIGQHDLSLLENVFGSHQIMLGSEGMKLQNGLLYVTYGSNDWVSFAQDHKLINPGISVFDTRGPQPMRQIAHFAAPGVTAVAPLPDGQALVAGDKLWLVGPPPNRGGN